MEIFNTSANFRKENKFPEVSQLTTLSVCLCIYFSLCLSVCLCLYLSVYVCKYVYTQAVVAAEMNFVPNRVLVASPPDVSPLESLLPRSIRTTLSQLCFGHCQLLNTYKARITSGISDVCPQCGVAPHSVEHLFNC